MTRHDRLRSMSLRNLIRLFWVVLAILWACFWFGHLEALGGWWALLSALLVIVVGIAVANVLARRSLRRFRKALSVGDIPVARQEHANLVDFWRRRGRETMKAYGINILLLEERYEEALKELEGLDSKKLGKTGSPVIQNQIACCKALLGDPAKAIELSQSVLPRLESIGPDYSASGHLVLGIANFLIGRPSEAVSHLQTAYTTSRDVPTRKAMAAFYLGEALSAAGKPTEAREAYQNANEALPNGRFGMRALERLK